MMLFHSQIPFQTYQNRGQTVYTPILPPRDIRILSLLRASSQRRQWIRQQGLRSKVQARSSFHIDHSQRTRVLQIRPGKGLSEVMVRHTNRSGRFLCRCLYSRIRRSIFMALNLSKPYLLYPCENLHLFQDRRFLLAMFQGLQCRISSLQGLTQAKALHWIEDCLVSIYRTAHIRAQLLPETFLRALFRRLFPGQSNPPIHRRQHLFASFLQRLDPREPVLLLPSPQGLFKPKAQRQCGVLGSPLIPYLQRPLQARTSHLSQQAVHQS